MLSLFSTKNFPSEIPTETVTPASAKYGFPFDIRNAAPPAANASTTADVKSNFLSVS